MTEVRTCFVGLIQAERGQLGAFERWHAVDHQPENWALPEVVYANRWLARGRLARARAAQDVGLRSAQFLITYFFREPVEEAVGAFNQLAVELGEAGRAFARRRVIFGRYLDLRAARVASALPISVAALPHTRHSGVWLELSSGEPEPELARLQHEGVLGGYCLTQRPGDHHDALPVGSVTAELYWLGRDPAEVWERSHDRPDAWFSGVFGPSR